MQVLENRARRRCTVERVNGTATVLGEDDAILISDDVACGTMGCGVGPGEGTAGPPCPIFEPTRLLRGVLVSTPYTGSCDGRVSKQ